MVLVVAESQKGQFRKAAFEAVTYGYKTAQALGTECVVLTFGSIAGAEELGKYGASKIYNIADAGIKDFDSQVYTAVIAEAAQQLGANVIVLNHSANGRSLVGRLAARLNAASAPGVNSVPTVDGGNLKVKKSVYSGKAIAELELKSPMKIISLMGNSLQPQVVGEAGTVENLSISVPQSRIKVKEVKQLEGKVSLPEAELVVSGGRGLKGPENWGIVEELAETLGATTACSRPVADAHWRPHHEHVGQTGIAIRPNLYIAIGISGAIQHLAGVNSSKTIVVINKDPEAPFFKAADYGVVGDLFEIVPRLTEAVKQFKAAH
ncbi:MAG: electron transfer flavoprotein subunit alpha/FixB family protein [Saprospiraceae bacterium]